MDCSKCLWASAETCKSCKQEAKELDDKECRYQMIGLQDKPYTLRARILNLLAPKKNR